MQASTHTHSKNNQNQVQSAACVMFLQQCTEDTLTKARQFSIDPHVDQFLKAENCNKNTVYTKQEHKIQSHIYFTTFSQ